MSSVVDTVALTGILGGFVLMVVAQNRGESVGLGQTLTRRFVLGHALA